MRKAKRYEPERLEVQAYIEWFKIQYPGILVYKIQNEGKRNPSLSKKIGIQAGMPDLNVVKSVGKYHTLYIEMKRPDDKGVLTENQKRCIEYLRSVDHAVEVCVGWDAAREATIDYFNGHYHCVSHSAIANNRKHYG